MEASMEYKWTPLFGDWQFIDEQTDSGVFHGREVPYADSNQIQHPDGYANALALCDAPFAGGGSISVGVRFSSFENAPATNAGVVFWAGPSATSYLAAGFNLATTAMYAIRGWNGKSYIDYGPHAGTALNLRAQHDYQLKVSVAGSTVQLEADGIQILSINIPFQIPFGPIGVTAFAKHDVEFHNFAVSSSQRSKAFVIMQFTAPYNELHEHVIKPVCEELGINAERADDTFGPGVILQDVVRAMLASDVVIAEITPTNANVYYEVGYAHALKKPCILIAAKGTQLPFDVSGFRVLVYENTIDGKRRVEIGLRRHLEAIQSERKSL
jgi:hypothetical protein